MGSRCCDSPCLVKCVPPTPSHPLYSSYPFLALTLGKMMEETGRADLSLGSDVTASVTRGKLSDWQRRSEPWYHLGPSNSMTFGKSPLLIPHCPTPTPRALPRPLGWIISVTPARHIYFNTTPTPGLHDNPLVCGKDIPEPSQLFVRVYDGLVPDPPRTPKSTEAQDPSVRQHNVMCVYLSPGAL